jgi:hypothetical protein
MGDIITTVYVVWQLATGWPHQKNLIYPEDWPKEMDHPRSSTTIHTRNLVEYIDCIIHQAEIGSLLDDSLNFHTSDKQKMLCSLDLWVMKIPIPTVRLVHRYHNKYSDGNFHGYHSLGNEPVLQRDGNFQL